LLANKVLFDSSTDPEFATAQNYAMIVEKRKGSIGNQKKKKILYNQKGL